MPIPNPDKPSESSATDQYQFTDILKAINFTDPNDIARPAVGKQVAAKMWSDQTSTVDNLQFFQARAAKWLMLLRWATGTQPMEEFLDYFDISDANKAYVKIDMTPVMVGPQFVNTLVDSIIKNEEYPCVSAIDDDSVHEKEEEKRDALFRMHEVETIADVQQRAGMAIEPPNAYVPDDALSAEVYFEMEYRTPKEIGAETFLQSTLTGNDYQPVLRRKMVYDLVVHNITMTKIERRNKKYVIRECIPLNIFYNYFTDDTGRTQLGYCGEFYSLKVRDVRERYGLSPERPKGMTEQQIFELAKLSSTRTGGSIFNFQWKQDWNVYNYNRPWDDYSIYVMDFAIQISESDYYVGKTDSFGKLNIAPKMGIPEPTSPNAVIYKKSKNRWWNGIYCPYADTMLSWERSNITILPYNDTESDLCPFTIVIPNNNGMYVSSLFERAMEPLKEYAITKLKRKQLISQLRPSGIRIDVEGLRDVTIGTGKQDWREVLRIFNQTGNEIWSSKGLDPTDRKVPPLGNTVADEAVEKIVGCTNLLQEIYGEIRLLLGVPPYRDGSSVGERTSGTLSDSQNESSFNVTDFISSNANVAINEVMRKICLLYWQDQIKAGNKELINTRFKVDVKMKQTLYEQQLLEKNIETAMKTIDGNGNPLLTFKDSVTIRNIKNYKMAERYLASTVETNRKKAELSKQQAVQQQSVVQQQSNDQAAKNEQMLQQQKFSIDTLLKDAESRRVKEQELVTSIMAIFQACVTSGKPFPPELMPLAQQMIQNVAMPIMQENKQMKQELLQQMLAEHQQMTMNPASMPPQQQVPPPGQAQPQPQPQPQMQPQ